jgi:DNA-binding MarR family transcriptional regulator
MAGGELFTCCTHLLGCCRVNALETDIAQLVERLDHTMGSLTRTATIRRFYTRLAATAGTSLERPAYLVLKQLVADGSRRITDLAAEHGVEASTMSRHTKALEDAGLVAKIGDPHDRRVSLAEPTAAGRRLVSRFEAARHQFLAGVLSGWEGHDAERFVALFERFVDDVTSTDRPG